MNKYKTVDVRSETDEHGEVVSQVHAVKARSIHDKNRIAIHLLNPTKRELDDAFETAFRDMFDLIICHNSRTWPKS